MRIGHGFDAHRFTAGGRLVLGGVEISFDRSLQAHSDGDVVLHALCDALIGAAAMGDIGLLFPDTDPDLKGVDSRVLLRGVMERLTADSMRVSNVDITIIAQVPRLRPHVDRMCKVIADDLQMSRDDVNVKATTTEGMGFTGREEGIAAHAVVLLDNNV